MTKYLEAVYKYDPPLGYGLPFEKRRFRLTEPDEHGRLKTFQLRYRPDRMHKPQVWVYHIPAGVGGVLYRMADLPHGYVDSRPICSVEGEKDAESLVALGHVACTHWQAAGNFTPEQADYLASRQQRIRLLYDNDGPGYLDVIRRYDLLVAAGALKGNITVWRVPDFKDVSDMLAAGLPLSRLERVRDLGALREAAQEARAARSTGSWSYWVPPPLEEPWRPLSVVRGPDGTKRLDYVVADCSDCPDGYIRKDLR